MLNDIRIECNVSGGKVGAVIVSSPVGIVLSSRQIADFCVSLLAALTRQPVVMSLTKDIIFILNSNISVDCSRTRMRKSMRSIVHWNS